MLTGGATRARIILSRNTPGTSRPGYPPRSPIPPGLVPPGGRANELLHTPFPLLLTLIVKGMGMGSAVKRWTVFNMLLEGPWDVIRKLITWTGSREFGGRRGKTLAREGDSSWAHGNSASRGVAKFFWLICEPHGSGAGCRLQRRHQARTKGTCRTTQHGARQYGICGTARPNTVRR